MMLVLSRRSLILGVTSLVAAPALVRASSLMDLAGYELDPIVLAFNPIVRNPGWYLSSYSNSAVLVSCGNWVYRWEYKFNRKKDKITDWMTFPHNNVHFALVRLSELKSLRPSIGNV